MASILEKVRSSRSDDRDGNRGFVRCLVSPATGVCGRTGATLHLLVETGRSLEWRCRMNLALTLYAPRDIGKAHQLFGATCGPCSLAAAVRRDVCELREAFPTFPEKQFTNLPMMVQAIRSLGLQGRRTMKWPKHGLALVSGPERYHSRHWLAVHHDFVYEVSLETWLPLLVWERDFLPE